MKSHALVEARIGDPELVGQRRAEIIRAAIKLFSEHGYYVTTIQQVAREAGISVGLVYQYFRDKDDILFLALKSVLDTYEQEIPRSLAGITHPLARLRAAFSAYCAVIDRLREATVLTYRSTKSLRPERRRYIKEGELRTNRLLEACVQECIRAGYLRSVNVRLLVYQYVLFAHAWALKGWAWRGRYTLRRYVREGLALLVDPFLTPKGRRVQP